MFFALDHIKVGCPWLPTRRSNMYTHIQSKHKDTHTHTHSRSFYYSVLELFAHLVLLLYVNSKSMPMADWILSISGCTALKGLTNSKCALYDGFEKANKLTTFKLWSLQENALILHQICKMDLLPTPPPQKKNGLDPP